jgi:hypothetical protein
VDKLDSLNELCNNASVANDSAIANATVDRRPCMLVVLRLASLGSDVPQSSSLVLQLCRKITHTITEQVSSERRANQRLEIMCLLDAARVTA